MRIGRKWVVRNVSMSWPCAIVVGSSTVSWIWLAAGLCYPTRTSFHDSPCMYIIFIFTLKMLISWLLDFSSNRPHSFCSFVRNRVVFGSTTGVEISRSWILTRDTRYLWTQGTFGHKVPMDTRYLWTRGTFGDKVPMDTRYLWTQGTFGHKVPLDTRYL